MCCSESHIVAGLYFNCRNPASVIAKTYKHGDERGLCTYCFKHAADEDETFYERHEFREIE